MQNLEAPSESPHSIELLPEHSVSDGDLETLREYTLDENPGVAEWSEVVLAAVNREGADKGLTLKIVDNLMPRAGSFEVIPLTTFIGTFAEGHYPMAHPRYNESFTHDAGTHWPILNKLSEDPKTSSVIQETAAWLNHWLDESEEPLESFGNRNLHGLYEEFANIIEGFADLNYKDTAPLNRAMKDFFDTRIAAHEAAHSLAA